MADTINNEASGFERSAGSADTVPGTIDPIPTGPTLAIEADPEPTSKLGEAKQAIKDNAGKYSQQATDRMRMFAEDGKAKAQSALEQLSQMLNEAAGSVDEKLGAQYGQYARSAAESVTGFSASLQDKSVDDLMEDARGFVSKSPAVAIGAAAAIGFVLARLVSAGLDQRDQG